MKEDSEITDERLREAVDYLFEALTFRPPTAKESDDYLQMVKDSIAKVGREDGIFMGLSSIFLDRDALFRPELARPARPTNMAASCSRTGNWASPSTTRCATSRPDEHFVRRSSEGRMRTREDVEREVTRMLSDDSIRKPRILRFFRDYFDHDLAGYICKDTKALAKPVSPGATVHYRAMFDAAASTDRLIELILEKDKDVLRELLTTQQVVATKDRQHLLRPETHPKKESAAALPKRKQR